MLFSYEGKSHVTHLGKTAIAFLVLCAVSKAEAGFRYLYRSPYVYSPYAMPYVPFSPVASPAQPAMSSHVLVPAQAADGTPSYAAYHPTLGTFLGWWQLIGNTWRLIDPNSGGGGGGGGGDSDSVSRQDFEDFVSEYRKDIEAIKSKLPGGGAAGGNAGGGPAAGGGGAGAGNTGGGAGTTPQPGGPQGGTAVAPGANPAAAPALPAAAPGSAARVQSIIDKLENIKVVKPKKK
jgi:hypothetical protein